MVAPSLGSAPSRTRERRRWILLTGLSRTRRRLTTPAVAFSLLGAGSLLLGVAAVGASSVASPALMIVPVLAGAALLPMTWLTVLAVLALLTHTVAVALSAQPARGVPSMLAFLLIVTVVLAGARARSRLGVLGSRGELMLLDLREHLTTEGEIGGLPGGWHAEVVHRSAHGDSFGGDFLVAAVSPDETRFEVALVDVSGNGVDAGTRALMLSGAFGGLIGAVRPDQFLPAANRYLLRQHWEEGFATAVHIAADATSGDVEVASAGHPPAVQFHAGSGCWEVGGASGPALGLLGEASFERVTGRLLPGDAMLLYTDGLVETADRDVAAGLDRLIGEAERLVTDGFESGADRLIAAVSDSEGDDRACVLIWRR